MTNYLYPQDPEENRLKREIALEEYFEYLYECRKDGEEPMLDLPWFEYYRGLRNPIPVENISPGSAL